MQEIDFKLNNNRKNATYDYDRIQWYMSWTNLLLAQRNFEGAFQKAEALQKAYPNDIASYAQMVNILMSQVVNLENQGLDTAAYVPLARRAVSISENILSKYQKAIFYEYLEKALKNRNPTVGITAALYANDQRWARFR